MMMAREDAAAPAARQGTLREPAQPAPSCCFFLCGRFPDADTFLFFCIKPLSGQKRPVLCIVKNRVLPVFDLCGKSAANAAIRMYCLTGYCLISYTNPSSLSICL